MKTVIMSLRLPVDDITADGAGRCSVQLAAPSSSQCHSKRQINYQKRACGRGMPAIGLNCKPLTGVVHYFKLREYVSDVTDF